MNLFCFFPLPVRNHHRTLALLLIPPLLLLFSACTVPGGMKDPTILYASPYTASLKGEADGIPLTLSVRRDAGSITVTAHSGEVALDFSAPLGSGTVTLTVPGHSIALPCPAEGGIPAIIGLLTRTRADLISLARDTVSGQQIYLAELSAESGSVVLTLTSEGIPLRLTQSATATVLHFTDFTPLSASPRK